MVVLPSLAQAWSDPVHAQRANIGPLIRGDVVEETTDFGISQALVELLDDRARVRASAVADRDGNFVLSGVPVGRFQLRVTRLGYTKTTTPHWWTESGEVLTVTVRLHPEAVLLAPLEITAIARSQSPVLSNFYHRVDQGIGGVFFTRQDIERRRPSLVTDLLVTVPGVRLLSSGRGGARVVTMGRASGCPAQIYMDGRLMSRGEANSVDEIAAPQSVEGIEVYRGLSTVPAEFLSPEAKCGVVALWTKRGR